jgi:hypothetical protein
VDTTRIQQPHRVGHDHQRDGPHACTDDWITLGQPVVDPETVEESEEHSPDPCRKCAERGQGVESGARVSYASRPSNFVYRR